MTTNLTQALKQGAEHALETMAEGWRELRSRAGGALTRFRSAEDSQHERGSDDFPAVGRWAYMAANAPTARFDETCRCRSRSSPTR